MISRLAFAAVLVFASMAHADPSRLGNPANQPAAPAPPGPAYTEMLLEEARALLDERRAQLIATRAQLQTLGEASQRREREWSEYSRPLWSPAGGK